MGPELFFPLHLTKSNSCKSVNIEKNILAVISVVVLHLNLTKGLGNTFNVSRRVYASSANLHNWKFSFSRFHNGCQLKLKKRKTTLILYLDITSATLVVKRLSKL